MINNDYYYVAYEYYGQGDGVCIGLLITKAVPKYEDYSKQPSFHTDDSGKTVFDYGILNKSQKEIAEREFYDKFNKSMFMCRGEVLSKEIFLEKYGRQIPDTVKSIINNKDIAPAFQWSSLLHCNFS